LPRIKKEMDINSVNTLKSISDFYVVGINYRNTDAGIRGQYALSTDQYIHLLETAKIQGIEELFVLSTCNRTEIYGVATSAKQLAQFLCSETKGSYEVFAQQAYFKQGKLAIEHLLQVAAGLDSQILGDYEIISQLKQSVKIAKEYHCIGLFTEKLVHTTLQSSRVIRSNTKLSSGSVSVSFAAVQYIQQHFTQASDKKILLIGVGKIGRNTCKNIVTTLGTNQITLINRTNERAEELATSLGIDFAPYHTLEEQAQEAEVILVATNAPVPTLLKRHIEGSGSKLIIDLSIPYNVETAVASVENIRLVNVDELSKVADETLQNRLLEVPKAQTIIAEHILEFKEWYSMRQHVPLIKAAKSTLQSLQRKHQNAFESAPLQSNEHIQKVLNNMATQLRQKNQGGCNFILAINDFMTRS
jgi:glutamyl-tRNA reductase